MIRLAARGGLALALIAVVIGSAARGQPALPRVEYRDPKDGQIHTTDSEIKAGAVGYQIVPSGSKIPISLAPANIIRVFPGELPGLDRNKDIVPLFDAEKKGDTAKALTGYEELRKRPGLTDARTRQFLEFKRAILSAQLADAAAEAGWKDRATEAAGLLDAYLGQYQTGWELWPLARTYARLQLQLGQPAKAADMWARLTRMEVELPADLRVEAGLQEVDSLIRARDWSVAGTRAKAVAAGTGPAKERATIYQIAAQTGTGTQAAGVKLIEDQLAKTKDPAVRATGYEMIGELYLAAKKPRDAMWAYLWVEVVYNQDRDEVAKAMIRLAEVFAEQGDEERAKTYREKLLRFVSAH